MLQIRYLLCQCLIPSEVNSLTLDLMILLQNLVLTMPASCVISQMHEKARRSSPPRNEQRLELRSSGTMSILCK